MRRSLAALAIWLCSDIALSACPICFQVEDAGVVSGVRAAVVVLGGVTAGVLVGVALFARRLVNAERAEPAEPKC
jgi:threonine/homoserine/homoserine lactone efflux protein